MGILRLRLSRIVLHSESYLKGLYDFISPSFLLLSPYSSPVLILQLEDRKALF
jgi:hypothetical protein